MTTFTTLAVCQTLLALAIEGEGPVRFGFPLPAEALARGLRLSAEAGARLQWAPLQSEPDPRSGRQWVEIAIVGARGRVRIAAGGDGPATVDGGTAVTFTGDTQRDDAMETTTGVWRWIDGSEDRSVRTLWYAARDGSDDERRGPGEAHTERSPELLARTLRVRIGDAEWRSAGVLPPASGLGRAIRKELLAAIDRLPPAPGQRGVGDYVRSDGVVTNLEFDTTLAFARLGLAEGDRGCLARAMASATHLLDVDLDRQSGLPFRHGTDHRRANPDPGHAWLSGLLLTGCLFADRPAIDAALALGRSLAEFALGYRPPSRAADRARDLAWPLYEVECAARFTGEPGLARAADRLAARLLERWDPALGTLRFGEGESMDRRSYTDRAWLTGGLVVPALRRFVERTGDPRAAEIADALELRLVRLLTDGRRGIPLQCILRNGVLFPTVRRDGAPEAFLLLEGLRLPALRRCLERGGVRDALEPVLDAGHPDLATHFSIVGRCEWILR